MWDILKIEPTDDLKEVKKAYSKLLRQCHPEDDPEGYQRLREAYDWAINQIKGKKKGSMNMGNFSSIHKTLEKEKEKEKDEENDNYSDLEDDYYDEYESEEEYKNNNTQNLNSDYLDNYKYDEQDHEDQEYEDSNKYKNLNKDYLDDYKNDESDKQSDKKPKPKKKISIIDKKMNRIRTLYDSYFKRINIKNWKIILESDDIIHNFDATNKLGIAMIDFVYENHYLPNEILQYLNRIFDWEARFTKNKDSNQDEKLDFIIERIRDDKYIDFSVDFRISNLDYGEYMKLRIDGYLALLDDNLDTAYSNLKQAIKMYDDDPVVLKMLCEYYKMTEYYNKGYRIASQLVNNEDYNYEASYYKSYFAHKLGNYEIVIDECDILLDIEKKPEFYYLKASAQTKLGSHEESLKTIYLGLKEHKDDYQLNILLMFVEKETQKTGVYYSDIEKKMRKEESKKDSSDVEDNARQTNKQSKPKNLLGLILKVSVLVCVVIAISYFSINRDSENADNTDSQSTEITQQQSEATNSEVNSGQTDTEKADLKETTSIEATTNEQQDGTGKDETSNLTPRQKGISVSGTLALDIDSGKQYNVQKTKLEDLNAMINIDLAYLTKGSTEGTITYFVFNYRQKGINYIILLDEDEKELYYKEDGNEILNYMSKPLVISRQRLLQGLRLKYDMSEEDTVIYDGL